MYTILKGRWCHIIVLNVNSATEERIDDVKDRFYEELELMFDKFPKYHKEILLGDFNAKLSRKDMFKPTTGNESLHEISEDNGARLASFASFKILRVKSTMFSHCNIHKYTWTSPSGKTHNQIDRILVDRPRHSSIPDARSFMTARYNTDHYLLVAKISERLEVNKQRSHRFHMKIFDLNKLNKVKRSIALRSQMGLQLWKIRTLRWKLIVPKND
jgi:exonuclease III